MATIRTKKPQTDEVPQIGELPHKPHYEVRTASQSYSNIAAVLAGFAFAAVVLVVQTTPPSTVPDAGIFRDWATIAFLLSFIGCVVSAFVFATITGEEILAPRSHTMALLGGTGFSVSTNLVILGLAILIKIFLSPQIYRFVYVVFPLVMSLSPLFLAFSALDPIISFDSKPLTRKDLMQVFVPGFAPLAIIWVIKFLCGTLTSAVIASLFGYVMVVAFVAMVLSAISVLSVSSFAGVRFRLSLMVSGIVVGIHSVIIGLFILML